MAAETTILTTSSGGVKGSTRWMAPEMYSFGSGVDEEGEKEGTPKEDKTPRDIYAFACTVLEVRLRALQTFLLFTSWPFADDEWETTLS